MSLCFWVPRDNNLPGILQHHGVTLKKKKAFQKITEAKKSRVQVIEHLLSKHDALRSNPSIKKKKKKTL
jgi:hypothetical protein